MRSRLMWQAADFLSDERSALLLALVAAGAAGQRQEVPVGAVLQDAAGRFLGECGNRVVATADPSGHAELRLLRLAAARVGNYRLLDTALAVTLTPCPMCMAALTMARVARLTCEANSPWAVTGGGWPTPAVHHQPPQIAGQTGNDEENLFVGPSDHDCAPLPPADAGALLRIFFDQRRRI
ncbi:MAG: deaminase [Magnetococcus sp. DMHC-8]